MILADSSVLVEFFRAGGRPSVKRAVREGLEGGLLAVNGIIRVEVVGFARDAASRSQLEQAFASFLQLDLEAAEFELAVDLGFQLRRRGVTVPTTDLIIGASAIRENAELLHDDAHFDEIAKVSQLRSRRVVGQA
jgi:predicted nucleic acid-binding protein